MQAITPLPADVSAWDENKKRGALQERRTRVTEIQSMPVGAIDDETLEELDEIHADIDKLTGREVVNRLPLPGQRSRSVFGESGGGTFSEAIKKAGFNPVSKHRVRVPAEAALYVGAVNDFSGISTFGPRRLTPSVLGADQRFVYPALRQAPLSPTDTSVDYLKQTARTLADPADMVRAIDATTDKPETTLGVQIAAVTPSQVAHAVVGVPNIVNRQRVFADLIEGDLRLGLSEALDSMVVDAIAAASVPAGASGTGVAAGVRKAITAVLAAGYTPDTIALDPDTDEALDLALLSLNNSTGVGPLFGLQRRVGKSVATPFVFDSQRFGTLAASPVEFAAFEENAGRTNSMTFRAELNAAVIVDRAAAAATVTYT
jgi:hypothetical protein